MSTLQLVNPFVENHDGAASQRFSVARRVPAERARVDLGLGQLHGVPNQPALNALRLDLDVELQAEELRPFSKRLEWALRGKCEIVAARRKSEIIAMPMQNVQSLEVAQRACAAGRGQRDGSPPDLFRRAGGDVCTQRLCHELRAKTYAKRRLHICEPAA